MKMKTIPGPSIGSIVMIGAGLCAALLFTVARQGTLQAMALAYVTPLPIMISTLGFGSGLGLGSAVVGTLMVAMLATVHEGAFSPAAILTGAILGGIFALTQALPAWWLAFLGSLLRSDESSRWRSRQAGKPARQLIFYPIGNILVHAALIVIGLVGLAVAAIAIGYGGLQNALDSLTSELLPHVDAIVASHPDLPGGLDVHSLTQLVIKGMPAIIAASSLMMFVANLWLAGRIVLTSNKLRRPWPDIPHDLRLPRMLALVMAAAVGLCFVKNWPAIMGLAAAVTLGLIFALQGLAVIHDLTRGSRWRVVTLFGVYASLVLFIPSPLAIFALLGLADAIFSLRDRKAATLLASKS